MKIRLNEENLRKIVKESVKQYLNEYFYFNTDGDGDGDNSIGDETLDYTQAIGDLQYLCDKYGLQFHELPEDGKGTFLVTCHLDLNGSPEGDINGFRNYIKKYEDMGRVEEVGGGILKIGIWYRKYRIKSALSESKLKTKRRVKK